MALYKKLPAPDANETQLAYKLRYWPTSKLSAAANKLHRTWPMEFWVKADIILFCNQELTQLYDPNSKRDFDIVWRYNNIPTEQEWNKHGEQATIFVEFRDYWIQGKKRSVAILSFHYYPEHERLQPASK